MSALELLLAGLPHAQDAAAVAELLSGLATARGPQRVSLSVRAGGGVVRVRVASSRPTREFATAPSSYVRDLMALEATAHRWGADADSSGHTLWWAQLGTAARIGGAR